MNKMHQWASQNHQIVRLASKTQLFVKCHRVCHWMSIDQSRSDKIYGYMLLLRSMIFSHEIYTKDSCLEYATAYTDKYKDLSHLLVKCRYRPIYHIYLLSADIGQPGEYNTGNNVNDNIEGRQKTGNVRIGNRAKESWGNYWHLGP